MSDSNIPGITNKYNSQEAINKILEPGREKLKQMETDKEKLIEKKKVWNEIKQKTLALQNSGKKLYGHEAPFDDKVTESSNEKAFTAKANRGAEIGEYKIKILQKAKSHKVASDQLSKKYKVAEGKYGINVGTENYKISFSGGTLDDFAKTIKNDSKGKIKAMIAFDTTNTQILILEGEKSGEKNFISFADEKTKSEFKKMGFFEDVSAYEKKYLLSESNIKSVKSAVKPEFKADNVLVVKNSESYKLNLNEKIPYKEGLIFEIDMRLEKLDPNKMPDTQEPSGPDFSKKGELDIFNIQIEGESSITNIPPFEKPKKPEIIEDDHYIEIVTNKRTIKLDELEISSNKSTLRFRMEDILEKNESVESLIFKNSNTYKRLEVSNVRFYDEKTMAGIKFKNELESPQDAVFEIDGIKIKRDTNTIDDAVKDLTIFIFDKTDKEETLKIDRDYEKIVKAITDMVKAYNEFIELINKQTSTGASTEEAGMFSAEYGLISLTSKVRMIMMNSYSTNYGSELALLAQIGISTNSSKSYQMDKNKLKGLLEVDEDLFVKMMEKFPIGIKELFGRDTNSDMVIDTGAALELETLLKAYTVSGQGFYDLKNKTYDQEVITAKKNIDDYKTKMDKEEADLKQKFFKMEKAMKDLDDNTKKIDNFNKQN